MASMATQSALSTVTTSTLLRVSKEDNENPQEYHPLLLAIYSVVLLCGTISLSLMMHILKSNITSLTSIAVLNLIFTHFVFLLTVPFRIHYYATNYWSLGLGWCKVVSGMIHIHMYMSFVLYVVILITRLMAFYYRAEQVTSFQKTHVFLACAVLWLAVLVTVPCIIRFSYGETDAETNLGSNNGTLTRCFQFGESIASGAKVLNYIISTVIIVVGTVLTALQANILRVLYRKHRQGCTSQQDFGAQLKSLCFALIMVVCFIPYHMFRLNYLENLELQSINEVLLSLTTFNCLDMLTLLGRRTCYVCFLGKAI